MPKNLIGQKFGKLTVLEDSKMRASNGTIKWKCLCECGNICYVTTGNLTRKTNGTKSCGCKTNAKDLSGEKFGKLLALKPTDKRINNKVVWECQCDCGNIHYVTSTNLIHGQVVSCGKCNQKINQITSKRKLPEENIGLKFGAYTIIGVSKQKKNNYILYEVQCDNCGHTTLKTLSELKALKSDFCSQCRTKNLIGEKFGLLTPIELITKANSNKKTNTVWRCRCDCGNYIEVTSSNLKTGNTKSCGCLKNISSGELAIKTYLINTGIPFIQQKTFETCVFPNTKQLAKFDFYLPSYNLLIEYDGQQHFKEVSIFKDSLEEIQYRDKIKNNWCKENGIPLIRIPYTDYKNISEILDSTLKYLI